MNEVLEMDCQYGMRELESEHCDCCVTDPPYGIRFMGRKWDYEIPAVEVWKEVVRVLKPGAHALVACGTKTQHRMAVNIEEAGFEIRDVIAWHYGEGLPKSMNISLAFDKKFGAVGPRRAGDSRRGQDNGGLPPSSYQPITTEAKHWEGWGTGLKPATEFWTLARKPLAQGTILSNIQRYGVGGLNIDACRRHSGDAPGGEYVVRRLKTGAQLIRAGGNWHIDPDVGGFYHGKLKAGRFPANVVLDDFMAAQLDIQSGLLQSGRPAGARKAANNVYGDYATGMPITGYGDSGGASRFFYVAKADAKERGDDNTHPTVKPLALMHHLIKLICPIEPGRVVLDPFAGSGTTCIAARQLGLNFYAFEKIADYVKIAARRLRAELGLFYGV